MNIREKLTQMGVEHGLFESSAKEIMESVIKEDFDTNMLMGPRWDDDYNDYPESMICVLWITFKRHALVWLNKNQPQHWAKAVFEDSKQSTVATLQSIAKSVQETIHNELSLDEITDIANGYKKMDTAGSIGKYEAQALLFEHHTKYFQKLVNALKQADTTSCKGCSSLTPSHTCLKGNNTEAFSCCYHSIHELVKEVSSVKQY